ncbi:MAG: hypothetical protein IJW18_07575 [Lachnospiraceae bacterium]|nr:hypothetical protein [Lachnospiraceae bacterium]
MKKNIKDILITAIFLTLIFGLTILSLIKKTVLFSENENRYLAQKPTFSFEALFDGSYTSDYESFVTDQFVFRDSWIGCKTRVELMTLRKDINGVYFCDDDYLMEKHDATKFESDQAKSNVNVFTNFVNKYAEKFGPEHFQAILVPTASEVLKDKLPLFATPYDQNTWVNKINEMVPDGYVYNAYEALKDHTDEYIYYKTDHHWTTLGAYYTYVEWCKSTGLTPYELSDFDVEIATEEFLGTLDSKVNVNIEPDSMALYHLKDDMEYKLTYNMTDDVRDSLYHYDGLKGKDKYTVYMGGNYAIVDVETNVKNGKTLLVLKDSFGHSFVPFAANHYERIIMLDLRYYNMFNAEMFIEQYGVTDMLVLYNVVNLASDVHVFKMK